MIRNVVVCLFVGVAALLLAAPASADPIVLTFEGNAEFSGSGAGNFVGKLVVTVSSVGDDVKIHVLGSGMNGTIDKLYLNVAGLGTRTHNETVGTTDIDFDENGHKADGDNGQYDLLLDFEKLGNGAAFSYTADLDDLLLNGLDTFTFPPSAFTATNAPSTKGGPYMAAIHVHDNTGEKSGHYGVTTFGQPVPEPGTLLLMSSALGFAFLRRRRLGSV